MNIFGSKLRFSSFGESHGPCIGALIDGLPAGLRVDLELLKEELFLRKGGKAFTTPRSEDDHPTILSGVKDGLCTGTPVAVIVENKNIRSKDYQEGVFRPSHAEYTYFKKYKIVDFKGGGRASARESVARVIAGAFAKMLLNEFKICVKAGLFSVGKLEAKNPDFDNYKKSQIFALDREEEFKALILETSSRGDSVGSSVLFKASGVPAGLGEPLYDKLSSKLAHAFMGINAVKALAFGAPTDTLGSLYNDWITHDGFMSNHAGGLLGGLSNGCDIEARVHFKPTPSIFKKQLCIDTTGKECELLLRGRHDPCVGVRGSRVVESMGALVLADALLLNATATLENLQKIYL